MARITWMPNFTAIGSFSETQATDWQDAMDWARLEVELDVLKAAFLEWHDYMQLEHVDYFAKLPTWQFQTLGRVALLLNKGATPTADTMKWFAARVQAMIAQVPAAVNADEQVEDDAAQTAAQRRTKEYVDLYSFIDAVRVKFADNEDELETQIVERLKQRNPNRAQLKKLYLHYKESLADAMAEKANPEVAKTIDPLIVAVNVLASFTGNAKVASQSKKATAKNQKAVAGVTVKSVDTDTNITSVSPAMIPRSSVVVMYNTKTRKVVIYSAKADTKLSIKGTKVIGYDEATSFSKTLRKPKTVLPSLRDAANSKRVKMVLDKYVKGKAHVVNGQINKDTVIVKVFK